MKRVFIALPDLYGHRPIYCRQFCDFFLARDFAVTVATDLEGLGEYRELETLVGHPRVAFIPDTWRAEPDPVRRLRELVKVARAARPDVTLLAEADDYLSVLAAQLTHPWLRLPGWRVGLFIRSPRYIHEPSPSLRVRVFHEVVAKRLPVLEKALALDEVFVARHGGRYIWMPDIGMWPVDNEDPSETEAWQARISAFLATQGGRPVVVYVGMPQQRRNYAQLLQLACDVNGCFIHCGALHDPTGYPREELAARRELAERSALLESGDYYQSFETARVTLAAAKCVVLPYAAEHLTSSGVMLQTLMAGRPVLVADRGLMASRVQKSGLGETFRPDDWQDMRAKFLALDSASLGDFEDRIAAFLSYFSRDQFETAMNAALGYARERPRLP